MCVPLHYFEIQFSHTGLVPSEIAYYSGRQTQWLDYVPTPIIAIAITTVFGAVALQDGTLNVYSLTGRRLMPTMMLGSPCAYLCASEGILLALTSSATVYSWSVGLARE
jgi:protein HIRA/HIR1